MAAAVGAAGVRHEPARAPWVDRHFRWLLVAPATFVILLVGLFPFVYTLLVSFQNITMLEEDTSFQGFANYARLLSDTRFWEALGHTLIFLAIALPAELVLGFLLALLFLEKMPGRQIFVALIVLPVVVSPIVAGATWRLLFDNRFGPINQILSWIAGEPVTILWINNPTFVYPAILLAEIWQWTPFMFLLLWAALNEVDRSQLEAAEIDGASWWQRLWWVVLPAIRPVVIIALLIRGLDLFRLFDVVWGLTRGGPGTMTETISIYTYVVGFQQFETSYAAAMALVIILLLSAVVMTALDRVAIAR
ncbi:MAG: binding-protein-dependent transport systems inner membrane component [Geminicoccaceae bacterium]|nr:MAG: binding-protein-dependent transport systems inner membrane component [Geminicoccaceae bacterium]